VKARIDDGSLALVAADTLPVQIDLLKAGLSTYFLKDIKDGKSKPTDPICTGLDVCTPQNVATCVGGR
jgi:ribose transport system substrate-binding protein